MLSPAGANSRRPRRARRRVMGRSRVTGGGLNQPGAPKPRAIVKPPPRAAINRPAPVQAAISYAGAPASSAGADIRATAQQQLGQAQGGWREAVFRAAMNMGDPAILAKLRADPQFKGYKFANDPNSVFAQLGRQETTGLRDIDESSNQNNTFFSGLRLGDRTQLQGDISRDRLGAGTDYQNQLKDFAAALAAAQGQYDADIRNANRADTEAATAREAEARAAAAGAGGGGAPNPAAAASDAQRYNASQASNAAEAQARARHRARRRKRR